MSLKRFGMFKTKPPKGFDYKPLYYDEDKERREERAKQLAGRALHNEEVRVELQKKWSRLRTTQRSKGNSNLMLVLIIILLAMVSWWLLF
ncbi:MAG: hypothetical protein LAT54_01270 [Cryomorphaceae bacterium]|nr:hypothetical protein [Cryomorphaceae bacterium]